MEQLVLEQFVLSFVRIEVVVVPLAVVDRSPDAAVLHTAFVAAVDSPFDCSTAEMVLAAALRHGVAAAAGTDSLGTEYLI